MSRWLFSKPFVYEELLLRIEALVRRNFSLKWQEISSDWLEINKNTKEVFYNSNKIHLSKIEYDLLIYLLNYKGKIVSKKRTFRKSLVRIWWFLPFTHCWYLCLIFKKLNKDLIETIRWEWYLIK